MGCSSSSAVEKRREIPSQAYYCTLIDTLSISGEGYYSTFNGRKTSGWLGYVSAGSTFRVLDLNVYKDEFDNDIIYVECLSDKDPKMVEKTGYIPLKRTTVKGCMDTKKHLAKRILDLDSTHTVKPSPAAGSSSSPKAVANSAVSSSFSAPSSPAASSSSSSAVPAIPKDFIVTETCEHGDAFYGSWNASTKKTGDYIGRVSAGATLKLLDTTVFKNEFGSDIIKVQCITNKWDTEKGKSGYVTLKDTDAAKYLDSSKRILVLPSLSRPLSAPDLKASSSSSAKPAAAKPLLSKKDVKASSSASLIVTEINEHGDAFYGSYNRSLKKKDDYIGRVSKGATMELLDSGVCKDEYGFEIINVKVLTNEWDDEIGKTGWVGLKDTDAMGYLDASKTKLHLPSGKKASSSTTVSPSSSLARPSSAPDLKPSASSPSSSGSAVVAAADPPAGKVIVTEINEHGDAIYRTLVNGNKTDGYIGRVTKNATMELLDCNVYKNQFGSDIIHVKILTNEFGYLGQTGYLLLNDTDMKNYFNGSRRKIETKNLLGKASSPSVAGKGKEKVETGGEKSSGGGGGKFIHTIEAPSREFIIKESEDHSDAFYASFNGLKLDGYIGSISSGATMSLLDVNVYKDQYGLDIIYVKCLTNKWEIERNKSGWVTLKYTSALELLDEKKRKIILPPLSSKAPSVLPPAPPSSESPPPTYSPKGSGGSGSGPPSTAKKGASGGGGGTGGDTGGAADHTGSIATPSTGW